MKKLFNYYGGKHYVLKHLLPLIPPNEIYVEVFGGGASLLWNKEESKIEVYNDINPLLTNLFNIIKNSSTFEEFKYKLQTIQYNRETFLKAREKVRSYLKNIKNNQKTIWNNSINQNKNELSVDLAINFFTSIIMSYNGAGQYYSQGVKKIQKLENVKKQIDWFHHRLKNVVIENKSFEELIPIYDDKETFFYLDPPYLQSTRRKISVYAFEMEKMQYRKLIDLLLNIKGKVILSCYYSSIFDILVKKDWKRKDFVVKSPVRKEGKSVETILFNF